MKITETLKAAKIAHAFEKDINNRVNESFLKHYKEHYSWGTKNGNIIFDFVARKSRDNQLNEADDYALSLMCMLNEAKAVSDIFAQEKFLGVLMEALPYMAMSLSNSIQAEIYTELYPSQQSPTPGEQEALKILLEYDKDFKALQHTLEGIPQNIKEKILIEASKRPQESLTDIRNEAILYALGRPDLIWNDEFESILRHIPHIHQDNVNEFFRVFPVLSTRMTPIDIFNKVSGLNVDEIETTDVAGRKIKVTRHGNMRFTLDSPLGTKTFFSIDEVYDYLGTPSRERRYR
jgi:hypothetical protein